MDIWEKKEFKLNKILLAYLIASPFISGYLYFMQFELAGIVFTIFRIGIVICFLIGTWQLFSLRQNLGDVCGKGTFSLGMWFVIILGIGSSHAVIQGFLPGGFSEMAAIAESLLFFICLFIFIKRDRNMWIFTVDAFKYTGIAVALISYFEMFYGFKMPSSRFNEIIYCKSVSFHPATSIFVNENNLAAFLLIVCSVLIWQMLHETNGKKYIIKCIQLIIVIIPAVISDSTIFKLGIILITVMGCMLLTKDEPISKGVLGRCALQVSLPVLTCYVFKRLLRIGCINVSLKLMNQYSLLSNEALRKLIQGDSLMGQLQNTGMGTVTMRKNLFIYGLDAGKTHPLFGNGANSFFNIFEHNKHYLEKTGGMTNPHNFLVEIFVQYGGIAVGIFLAICLITFVIILRRVLSQKRSINFKSDTGFIMMMLIAFAITTIMPSGFFKCVVYFVPLFLAVIGIDLDKEKLQDRI